MAPPSVGGAAIPSAAAITSSAAAAAQFSTMPSGSGASSGATAAQVQAHIQAQAAAAAAAQQAASAQAAAAAAQAAAAQAAASQLTSSSVSFEPYTTRVWYNHSCHWNKSNKMLLTMWHRLSAQFFLTWSYRIQIVCSISPSNTLLLIGGTFSTAS